MLEYEELHLATNLNDLRCLAREFPSFSNMNSERLCNALKKLHKTMKVQVLDQEYLYVLILRYFMVYEKLLKSDASFAKIRFGSEYNNVLALYKETETSLEERYRLKLIVEDPIGPVLTTPDEEEPAIFNNRFISCEELMSALKKGKNILLVDARPDFDFMQSRIYDKTVSCINVPEQCVTAGLSANALGKKLSKSTQDIWDNRDSFDVLVLFDWNSDSVNWKTSKLSTILSALVDWDCNRVYKEQPVILNGGFMAFLETYPTMCSNPQVYLHKKDDELDELLDLDNIEYPNEEDNKNQLLVQEVDLEVATLSDKDNKTELAKEMLNENKKITLERHEVIAELFKAEKDYKNLHEISFHEDSNNTDMSSLRSRISNLRKDLNEYNTKKDDLRRNFYMNFDYDPEEALKNEDLQEIARIEEKDSEKMKILEVVAEERNKALEQARALKPELQNITRKSEKSIPLRPTIDRDTKPRNTDLRRGVGALNVLTSGLTGLKNIRNTCYMNTVIQCMKSIPVIKSLFCMGYYSTEYIRHPAAIIHQTADLIRKLWSQNEGIVVPQDFFDQVGALDAMYKKGGHEDCMEFFVFLLNHLLEDCSYERKQQQVMIPKDEAWYNQFEGRNSIFIDYFYHQIRIFQKCRLCNKTTVKFEIENTFMLAVPKRDFHLDNLMKEYMRPFSADGFLCSNCNKPVINEKKICREPKIMVIVLKRYYQEIINQQVIIKKNESKVHFEPTRFCFGNHIYKLHAIAMHVGSMDSGHYTAAALTPKGWYEFSDDVIRSININSDSIKKKACAFFYSKCD